MQAEMLRLLDFYNIGILPKYICKYSGKSDEMHKKYWILLTKRIFFSYNIYINDKEKDGLIMKRIKEACLIQTLHFLLKEDVGHDYAEKLVYEEVKKYKENLDKNRTLYKIISEETQTDGSIIIEIKKQYNTSPVGHYLD